MKESCRKERKNKQVANETRYRRWMITWNNWDEHFRKNATPELIVKKLNEQQGLLIQYIVVGKETAPTTDKQHLQIYVEYTHQATFSQMKDRFPGAHIETAFSPGYQCSMYCKKDNQFYEEGEFRSRKISVDDIASNVVSLLYEMHPHDIAEKFPEYAAYIVRNYKSLVEMKMMMKPKWYDEEEQ